MVGLFIFNLAFNIFAYMYTESEKTKRVQIFFAGVNLGLIISFLK